MSAGFSPCAGADRLIRASPWIKNKITRLENQVPTLARIRTCEVDAMSKFALLFLLSHMALSARAAKSPSVESVTVEQLTTMLSADQGKPDADIAKDISTLRLAERLPAARFARLANALPGEKSRQALLIVADSAAFLGPPQDAVLNNPTPGPAELRRMIVAIVSYVNTGIRQLPNFIATRETTAFEDRPAEDTPADGGAGTISLSYLPVH